MCQPRRVGKMTRMMRRYRRLLRESKERWLTPPSHRWPYPVMFIAGLPKSGTVWLQQLLGSVPGYKIRWPYDPDDCIYNHDVCDAVFATLPRDLHSVVKLHTRCTPANVQVLEKFNLRTVVMYRDPRAQSLSRYFHVLHDPSHRHHSLYNSITQEAGLRHSIELTLSEYVPWIKGWLPQLRQHPERFHEVRYRDLRTRPVQTLSRVLDFYRIHLAEDEVKSIIEQVAANTKFDLRDNLRKGRGTARKGIVGDWRNHFTDAHVSQFKETCGEFLIELGYERDLDWALAPQHGAAELANSMQGSRV